MIELTDGFVVEVDLMNFTLKKETGTVDKEGNPNYKTYGYFSNLKNAVKACIDAMQREELTKGTFKLVDALKTMNEVEKKFSLLLLKAIKEMEE